MRYPKPLTKGELIGITATSSGVEGLFSKKLDIAIKKLNDLGYKVKETPSVRQQIKSASNTGAVRAKEFMALYLDPEVKMIIPPWGGVFLMDILEYLDFEKMKTVEPKWVVGFSDTSILLTSLTLQLDIATAHGPNALDFGCDRLEPSVVQLLEVIKGDSHQEQYDLYQKEWIPLSEELMPNYNLKVPVKWSSLSSEKISMEGRLFGGCLDIICKLLATPYLELEAFQERYKEDGFIWYLESCEMNAVDLYLTLKQMKLAGCFKYCNGILFGRAEGYSDVEDFNIEDAYGALNSLNVPIIYDVDIGHMPPQLIIINGAYARVSLDGKGVIKQEFRR